MNLESFEAGLRLIVAGPGDQPLTRILNIAMDIADCPMGMIGVRRPDRFESFVSVGIPLAEYQPELARSEALARRLRSTMIVEDASADPDFAHHPYVAGAAGWRFIANAPLPMTVLPLDVVLTCADSRADIERRPGLIARLDELAAIAADEIRLIGDIAIQSERIASVRESAAMRADGIRTAGMPAALLDAEGRILICNDRLAALLGVSRELIGERIADLFPVDSVALGASIRRVAQDGLPANSVPARVPGRDKTLMLDLIRVVSAHPAEPQLLCAVTDRSRTLAMADTIAEPQADSPNVLSEFLLATLVWQKRLLRRGDIPYHALARWRASVRDTQLEAVKALKREPSGFLLDQLTDRMAAAATTLFGRDTFRAVVPVPCGNSGPNCLSSRLGSRIAERLGVDFIPAFAPIPVQGSSHPRRNKERPAMTVTTAPDVPVLLIDDVATSGAHVEEAAQLLLRTAPAVLPLVWIAD